MPKRIFNYLLKRGITAEVIQNNSISYNELGIVIPVFDENKTFLFNKYRHDPDIMDEGPKYRYDKGSKISLYGVHKLKDLKEVVICEGEFDSLVLEGKGIGAVTSTGGALSFQEEWKDLFKDKDVYLCLDNDNAGLEGKLRILSFLPGAKVVTLPEEVGKHGDITDFFIKLKKTTEDFRELMRRAVAIDLEISKPKKVKKLTGDKSRVERAKSADLETYLRFKNDFAPCPFHADKTPSLHRYGPGKKKWKCFSCGEGGDIIDLVMKLYNCSFNEAVETIIK